MEDITPEQYELAKAEMLNKFDEVIKSSQLAADKLKEVIDGGNLRSTLTMLKQDIVLRRQLENFMFHK